jgi:cytochrome d ubiquinol oxidase subunit I
VAAVASVAILISGDSQGRLVARYQPAKLAAMEGIFKSTEAGAPMHIFGIPDAKSGTVHWNVEIPGLLSFLVHRDFSKPVPGLDRFEPDTPPVALPFFSFHIMVGLGIYFVVLTWYAVWSRLRGKLFDRKWLLWIFVFSVIGPFAANELGWITAEVGRQPWIVYNQLRTADAVSRSLDASQVVGSIIMFGVIYALLFVLWIYLLNDKIQKGPEPVSLQNAASFQDALEVASRYPGHMDSLTEPKE